MGAPDVFVVTGASGAVGAAVAARLARRGKVVVVSRDAARGEQTAAAARAGGGDAEWVAADLSSVAAVRAAADEIRARHPAVKVLVNCAAVVKRERVVTVDGLETTFAVSHLAPFQLTTRLLPALEAAAPSRVITVTAPSPAPVPLDDLQREKKWKWMDAFTGSKAMNLLFGLELSRRVDGKRVASNLVHPGLVKSELLRETPGAMRFLVHLFSGGPDRAADGIEWLATAPELDGVTGRFWKGRKEIKLPPRALDAETARGLWEASERILAKVG